MTATGHELSLPKAHAAPEAKLGAFLESIPEAMVAIDDAGRMALANECAERREATFYFILGNSGYGHSA